MTFARSRVCSGEVTGLSSPALNDGHCRWLGQLKCPRRHCHFMGSDAPVKAGHDNSCPNGRVLESGAIWGSRCSTPRAEA